MNKQDYIEAFGREIEPLFANKNKIGLGAIRQSIMDEINETMRKKKIADAKHSQLLEIKAKMLQDIHNTIEKELPEISSFFSKANNHIIVNCGGSTHYIFIDIESDIIDSSLEYREYKFAKRPIKIDSKTFGSIEEMYESDYFRNLISNLYKTLARVEASKK